LKYRDYKVTLNRLLAIFSSLDSIYNNDKHINPYSLEVASDIGSLFELNFLKYSTNTNFENDTMNRKITVNIPIDFAISLASNLDIDLSEYVDLSMFEIRK
jgi:hypothetical protein